MKKTLITLMALTTLVTPLFAGGIEANAETINRTDNIINSAGSIAEILGLSQGYIDYYSSTENINSWAKTENGFEYYDTTGKKSTGWSEINGSWYRFNSNGVAQTGWFKETDGNWYYLQNDGSIKTGWMYENASGNWYYFNADGVMQRVTDVEGCYLSDTGAWTDKYLRSDEQGNTSHDFLSLFYELGVSLDNGDIVTTDKAGNEYKVTRYKIVDSNGNDVTSSVVIGTNKRIVRPV